MNSIEDMLPYVPDGRRRGGTLDGQCPAHPRQRTGALSVKEGRYGLLVKCWAGCSLEQIVSAMGLKVSDLFYNDGEPRQPRVSRKPPVDLNALAFAYRRRADDFWLRGQAVLKAAQGFDISQWTDDDLDAAIRSVADAHQDVAVSDRLDEVALYFREKELDRASSRRAA